MNQQFAYRLLNLLNAKENMSDEEYEYVTYYLESSLINVFKSIQVYIVAYISGFLLECLIMSFSYQIIRKYAGGWHALTSLSCSLISILCFVGFPWLYQTFELYTIGFVAIGLSLITIICVAIYAPADTEKNPLVSVSERKYRRKRALIHVSVITFIAFIQPNLQIRLLLITGLFIESMVITPLIYKITKRSYNNYENYEEEQ